MTSQEHDNAPHTMRGSEAAQGPHFGPGRLGLVALIAGIVAIGGCRTDESTAGITLVASETVARADADEELGYALDGDDVTVDAPTLTVQMGLEVILTLENRAGQYSNVRGSHNFAVVPPLDDAHTDVDMFTDIATRKIDDKVLWGARTPEIFTDDSATITFMPDAPGSYQYICTIPGHAQLGMRGTFVVENPE
ncbi:MAG: plastocyanin/azurin family copper-binding protein [Ilumatobacteraceae bacterium]